MAMARKANAQLDGRLLTHHPAGKECLEICAANGWTPDSADVIRLVRLWARVREGEHSESALSRTHLEYARWLRQHGHIGEDVAQDDLPRAA
jgi:hypothetical protein